MFVAFSEIIDRFLPGDIDVLARGDQDIDIDGKDAAALLRLSGLGLFAPIASDIDVPFSFSEKHLSVEKTHKYQMTMFGSIMRESLGFSNREYMIKCIMDLMKRTD